MPSNGFKLSLVEWQQTCTITGISEVQVKIIRSTSRFGQGQGTGRGTHWCLSRGGVGGEGGCTACSGVMLLDKLDPRGRKHGGLTPSIRREEPRWSYRKKKKKSKTNFWALSCTCDMWLELHWLDRGMLLIINRVGVKGHKENKSLFSVKFC